MPLKSKTLQKIETIEKTFDAGKAEAEKDDSAEKAGDLSNSNFNQTTFNQTN